MNKKEKRDSLRFLPAAKVILLGLVSAQVLSTYHVYLSNRVLYEKASLLLAAGYVTVFNAGTLSQVKTWAAAFNGGLFFTFTIGCFLSLVTFASIWGYRRFFGKKWWGLIPGLPAWAAVLWALNRQGLQPMASAYFVVIPLVAAAATFKWFPAANAGPNAGSGIKNMVIYFLPFMILVIVGLVKVDKWVFIDFRDNILLSNPIGIKINNFYYRYTLYPAEIIKSLDKKLIKTSRLEYIHDKNPADRLERALTRHDYLPVEGAPGDVILTTTENKLGFFNGSSLVLTVSPKDFLSRPHLFLKQFSDKTDGLSFFRKMILISLLVGLPICIYIFVFGLLQFILAVFLKPDAASILSSIICLMLGLGMMFCLQTDGFGENSKRSIVDALASPNPSNRTAAIKAAYRRNLDITQYLINERHLESPYIPERYWLAVALSISPAKSAEKFLFSLIKDPSINVRCKVYYALGKKKNRSYIPLLMEELENSNHIYEQMYAYNALKELGWKQTKPR